MAAEKWNMSAPWVICLRGGDIGKRGHYLTMKNQEKIVSQKMETLKKVNRTLSVVISAFVADSATTSAATQSSPETGVDVAVDTSAIIPSTAAGSATYTHFSPTTFTPNVGETPQNELTSLNKLTADLSTSTVTNQLLSNPLITASTNEEEKAVKDTREGSIIIRKNDDEKGSISTEDEEVSSVSSLQKKPQEKLRRRQKWRPLNTTSFTSSTDLSSPEPSTEPEHSSLISDGFKTSDPPVLVRILNMRNMPSKGPLLSKLICQLESRMLMWQSLCVQVVPDSFLRRLASKLSQEWPTGVQRLMSEAHFAAENLHINNAAFLREVNALSQETTVSSVKSRQEVIEAIILLHMAFTWHRYMWVADEPSSDAPVGLRLLDRRPASDALQVISNRILQQPVSIFVSEEGTTMVTNEAEGGFIDAVDSQWLFEKSDRQYVGGDLMNVEQTLDLGERLRVVTEALVLKYIIDARWRRVAVARGHSKRARARVEHLNLLWQRTLAEVFVINGPVFVTVLSSRYASDTKVVTLNIEVSDLNNPQKPPIPFTSRVSVESAFRRLNDYCSTLDASSNSSTAESTRRSVN